MKIAVLYPPVDTAAQETGRPEWEPRRSEDDLENSWIHMRAALTGERV